MYTSTTHCRHCDHRVVSAFSRLWNIMRLLSWTRERFGKLGATKVYSSGFARFDGGDACYCIRRESGREIWKIIFLKLKRVAYYEAYGVKHFILPRKLILYSNHRPNFGVHSLQPNSTQFTGIFFYFFFNQGLQ